MGIDNAGLVDTKRGLIGRRIFIEPEIARSLGRATSSQLTWAKTRCW